MKKRTSWVFFLLVVIASSWMLAGLAGAEGDAKKAEKSFDYVGAKKCKMCHNKEATGAQYTVWSEGAHAKAFATLATDAAKADAKKQGLGDPQKEAACLQCHVTAFPVMGDLENQTITLEEGVWCESCHGPGSDYKSLKVKKGIAAGTTDPATVGLMTPSEETCLGCHKAEGNSFFKEFKYEERVKAIAHPDPSKK